MIRTIKLFIIASSLLLFFIVVGLYIFKLRQPTQNTSIQPNVTLSLLPSRQIDQISSQPTGETILVSEVSMKNFYTFAENIKPDGEVVITQNDNYRIIYTPQREYFLISILSSPFEEIRNEAETVFLQLLGITQDQACHLNLSITTPRFVDPEFAGKSHPLSFCTKRSYSK